jgi:hypothetical protein
MSTPTGPDPAPVLGGPDPVAPPVPERGVGAVLALYTLARAALLAVIAGLLVLAGTPLVIAVLVALIVALPLSMLLFRGLRARLDGALAASRARRVAERAALRARLRGDGDATPETPDAGERADRTGADRTGADRTGETGPSDAGSGDRPQRKADGGGD